MLQYRRLFKYRMARYSGSYDISPKYRLIIRYSIYRDTIKYRYRTFTSIAIRPGAIPTPESNNDSDSDSRVGIICSSFWWSRNRNRGDWNRSRNRGDWNRSRNCGKWNRITIPIPHIYVYLILVQEVTATHL